MHFSKPALVSAVVILMLTVSPAVASTSSERTQNKRISQALKTAKSASKTAKSASKTAKSASKTAKSASNTAKSASRTANGARATLNTVNTYGMLSPELGVATVYAGNGPASPTSPKTPLSAIGTVFSSQIPRGGNNAAQASGTVLYNCTGPTANPSAGCDVQVRAAIRTTRAASDVSGSVGGGVVITQLNGGATNNAVDGSLTGNASGPRHDPVGAVGFTSQAPTNHDGTLLTLTPGVGSGIGIESDSATIHIASPGLYEIQGTVQFYDAK